MKKIFSIIFTIALLLIFSGCTQNGGPKGELYGRWHLRSIEAEGMDVPAQTGDIYWSFQDGMIMMQLDEQQHDWRQTYGNFRLNDNTLFLDFPEQRFPPIAQTGLPREAELQVLRLTHSEMTLMYHPTLESSLTYYFHKW